ncbi:MAG: hypothetical protein OEZ43_05200 [Gammaproteobacteria bacterium]|nr:hypothetical protein [Gammaproteobacteria bacterium]
MSAIGKEMIKLYPDALQRDKLTATHKQNLEKGTANMLRYFREAGPHLNQKSTTYKLSYSLILDYLEKTQSAISRQNWEYATNRLASLGEVCTSCHTQDSALRTLFSGAERQSFPDDLAYAEFNYFTRNYELAEQYYDAFLKSGNKHSETALLTSYRRLVTIYAQIYNRPGEGANRLQAYLKTLKPASDTKDQLVAMIYGLQSLEQNGLSKVNRADFDTLQKYVNLYLGKLDQPLSDLILRPEEEVSRVWLRGQLYHFLNDHPDSPELPKILFWLAVSDRSLDYAYFFSLADMYLMECMLNHQKHPYAKRCYQEYREYLLFSYTGSGGEFLPDEVEDELEKLKSSLAK